MKKCTYSFVLYGFFHLSFSFLFLSFLNRRELVASTHLLPRSAESSLLGHPLIPDQKPWTLAPCPSWTIHSKQSSECTTCPLQSMAKTFTILFIETLFIHACSHIHHAMSLYLYYVYYAFHIFAYASIILCLAHHIKVDSHAFFDTHIWSWIFMWIYVV